MATTQWQQLNNYAGVLIKGEEEILPPSGERAKFHVDRAYWLTTKVETGARFGSVMSYDGTGMTAGPDQHIAVYPAELATEDFNAEDDQGGLWKLLRRMEVASPDNGYQHAVSQLFGMFADAGWYLAQDGVLRYLETGTTKVRQRTVNVTAGELVYGWEIRNSLAPPEGKVPKTGPDWEMASGWAELFHNLTAHPAGHVAQLDFGKEHLVKRTKKRPITIGGTSGTVESIGYATGELTAIKAGEGGFSEELDLAFSVYQSNCVNAPAIANKVLATTPRAGSPDRAKKLIQLLGNNDYGRWDDDIKGGRYQRTRQAARDCGLWSKSLFDGPSAIMPADLPG